MEAQGLYYDEVSFAPAALVFRGIKSEYSVFYSFNGFPLFITSYQGAILSYIYGLYLLLFKTSFSIASWRMFNPFIWSITILIFSILCVRLIKPVQLFVFLFLLISDVSLLLSFRFNFGQVLIPVIASLFIILFALNAVNKNKLRFLDYFIPCFLLGLAIYAKLSAIMLLIPTTLIILFLIYKKIANLYNILISLTGLILGVLPVIVLNLNYLIKDKKFFSLINTEQNHFLSASVFFIKLYNFLSIGTGNTLVKSIFAESLFKLNIHTEIILLLLIIIIFSYLFIRGSNYFLPYFFLSSWITIFLFLYLLPMDTFIYHYLFAVPFLYISISISLNISNLKYKRTRYVYVLFLIFLSFLTINRILNYSNVLNKLSKGSYSEIFHPEYTTLAKLASQKATDSVFIAADWGFGIQIYLFSNGAEKAVYEPFWNYNSIDQLENTILNSGKKYLYLVNHRAPSNIRKENTIKIMSDINKINFLTQVEIEQEFKNLKLFKINKYKII